MDYFDPVSFDILKNGGKIFFLNPNDVGGLNLEGNRKNKFEKINSDMDFGDNLIHFAGVGSGMKFYFKGKENANQSYVNWSLKQFAIYYKLFYNFCLEDIFVDEEKIELLKMELKLSENIDI